MLFALNGCQGSGKSTLCAYLQQVLVRDHGLRTVCLSLDDVYLSTAGRAELARTVHPLFATRGVPGTHDLALLHRTLDALLGVQPGAVALPRFDKTTDNPVPDVQWPKVETPVDIVLLEGWCLGASAQSAQALAAPVNALEAQEDADGEWRGYVNAVVAEQYPELYARVDSWAMLAAPHFDCVTRWRLEQEARQRGATEARMSTEQVARFVLYFQRITEHCLEAMPQRVDYLFRLDEQRDIVAGPSF